MRRWRTHLVFRVMVTAACGAGLVRLVPVTTGPASAPATGTAPFAVGAADADITPPALDTPLGQQLDDAAFVPVCGSSEAQIAQLWPGNRLFAFTDPYVDLFGTGQYVPGDPYCDADAAHRYQAPYVAGGSGANRWPRYSADAARASSKTTLPSSLAQSGETTANDPIGAHAVVFTEGSRRIAMVTVDSIGIFDTTMDQIRAAVHQSDPSIAPADVFISSTHDESAPDPIGLWGPDLSQEPAPVNTLNGNLPASATSGVDEFYMQFLVQQVASAVVKADHAALPAALKLAVTRLPSNLQSCWSSYPFVDTQLMPVMQAVTTAGASPGQVIFTMVDVGTHDESLAFSGYAPYVDMLSGDWTGRLSNWLEQAYPGSVGMEMAGLVGSVETPALYPQGSVVTNVPGALHDVPGNPVDACRSVYPEPSAAGGGAAKPMTDALAFVDTYGQDVAQAAEAALAAATPVVPGSVQGQVRDVCVQLENNFFAAAFAAGLFPDRPAYLDPQCTVGVSLSGQVATGSTSSPSSLQPGAPAFLRTQVGVLSVGPAQIAYSPGEIFPFTEVGGPVDPAQMPFPTDCYQPSLTDPTNPAAGNYSCGTELPMTNDVTAEMTQPYRFLAGLGEDMIGYLFPPGNFVGSQGQTVETPWSVYEDTTGTSHDRFGYGHSDDSESAGQHAGLAVTQALQSLLAADGTGAQVVPGLFLDTGGHLCDSPFPANAVTSGDAAGSWVTDCKGFTGAVGVQVVDASGKHDVLVGTAPGDASGWATYLATPDTGTAGTAYPYSVATRGVIVDGTPLLLDVFAGADALGGTT